MRDAFSYLASAIASLLLFFFLLRLLLQLVRADFRNPLAQGIVQLTNWLVLPLRKLLPPIGKLDSASFVAVVLIAAAGVGLQSLVRGGSLPDPALWVQLALLS
ncbi:MAG: YggT family protein, partial [Steroidobacteraceae bacterium]|nr:YggT family protein [Steroidobacteraceae bacterium]MDW8259274.1 YggT family protein [Gammaproteobacteria bacterium]